MAKPSSCNSPPPEKQPWGTWEELLLACAVHRYGPDSWDSVASEVQRRSPSLGPLTGLSCKLKYRDLRRRFRESGCRPRHGDTTKKNDDSKGDYNNGNGSVPWLEELTQLRVAELRREVERYDLSIVSLQSKVKRLTEERKKEKEKEASDLVGMASEKASSGEGSDRDCRSVNESNWTDTKSGNPPAGADEENKPPVAGPATGDPSCNSVAEEPAKEKRPDGGDGEGKESSEVQSLARREEKKTGKAEEEDNEGDRSPAVRCVGVKSQPFPGFLEILWSHRLGSFFQRRLETQETDIYRNLIRQHIDLETVRSRLEEGWYSGCIKKSFRDLLILFNNAIVFFNKRSPEFLAAIELRKLVSKEIARNGVREKSPELQEQQQPENSLEVKPNMRVVMVACRKRSSIPPKASSLVSGGAKKGDDRRASNSPNKEPAAVDLKKQEKSSDIAEENCTAKKRMRDKPTPSSRQKITSKNSKTRGSTAGTNKDSDVNSKSRGSLSSKAVPATEKEDSNVETETRGGSTNTCKKKGAASFLNRMKRGSTSASNKPLLESLRQPATGSIHDKGKEIKRSNSGSAAPQSSRKGSGGKQETQRASPMKKGRPPKRAASSLPPLQIVSGKRRDGGRAGAGSSTPAKKRSKR